MSAMTKYLDGTYTDAGVSLWSRAFVHRIGFCLCGVVFFELSHGRGWSYVYGNEIPYGVGVE